MPRKPKDPRGGARPGAGRKPIGPTKRWLSIPLELTTIAALGEAATAQGKSRSGLVVELIERGLTNLSTPDTF